MGQDPNLWSSLHIDDIVDLYNRMPGESILKELNCKTSFVGLLTLLPNRLKELQPCSIEEATHG
jgi:hypothetical protein